MNCQLVESIYNQKKIPIEIIHIILKYLRQPQPDYLTKDIKNYTESYKIVLNAYENILTHGRHLFLSYIERIENDLLMFGNNYRLICLGIQPKLHDIFMRYCNINNRVKNIDFYTFLYSNNYKKKSRINMLWGLFTVSERTEFINEFINAYFG